MSEYVNKSLERCLVHSKDSVLVVAVLSLGSPRHSGDFPNISKTHMEM